MITESRKSACKPSSKQQSPCPIPSGSGSDMYRTKSPIPSTACSGTYRTTRLIPLDDASGSFKRLGCSMITQCYSAITCLYSAIRYPYSAITCHYREKTRDYNWATTVTTERAGISILDASLSDGWNFRLLFLSVRYDWMPSMALSATVMPNFLLL